MTRHMSKVIATHHRVSKAKNPMAISLGPDTATDTALALLHRFLTKGLAMILTLIIAILLFSFIRWQVAALGVAGFLVAGPIGLGAVLLSSFLWALAREYR